MYSWRMQLWMHDLLLSFPLSFLRSRFCLHLVNCRRWNGCIGVLDWDLYDLIQLWLLSSNSSVLRRDLRLSPHRCLTRRRHRDESSAAVSHRLPDRASPLSPHGPHLHSSSFLFIIISSSLILFISSFLTSDISLLPFHLILSSYSSIVLYSPID